MNDTFAGKQHYQIEIQMNMHEKKCIQKLLILLNRKHPEKYEAWHQNNTSFNTDTFQYKNKDFTTYY